jgi:choline dehydrogenase-like flavoprotein
LIVMPRCRSSASESVWVVPSSTLPTSSMTPAA